jgi:hypothetical protein
VFFKHVTQNELLPEQERALAAVVEETERRAREAVA